MPSPFPGMDPYLERPDRFPNLHNSFNTYLQEALQPLLPDPYFAVSGERTWIEVSERSVEPDAAILTRGQKEPFGERTPGAVAVLAPPQARMVVVHVPHDEYREPFLDIYRSGSGEDRLVTAIEVHNPTNKTPGEHGRDLYQRKQREILDSPIHLVEIDLLRAGVHTTAVQLARAQAKAGPFDYHVCIHRFDQLEEFFVYPIRLEEALPTVRVPLLPGDGEVELDLQAVFGRCYEIGPYSRRVNYLQETPVPPLKPEQAEWARARITAVFGKE